MEEWLGSSCTRAGKISPGACFILINATPNMAILEHYDIYYFNSSTIKNSKEMLDLLTKAATLTSFIPKPKIAIFDDLEMLVQHDRVYLNLLLEILQKQKLPVIPIIMVFPHSMEKKTRPFIAAGAKVFKGENNTTIQEKLNFKDDPWLAPLCFHENLEKDFTTRYGSAIEKRKAYVQYLDALCNWNHIMSKDMTSLAMDLINYETTSIMRRFKRKPGAVSTNVEFTKMLSQLSLYKKKERAKYTTNDSLFCI